MQASEFAALLGAKQIGRGKWLARCPAHGDKRPSLRISAGNKHPVVFHCMSQGCTQKEILAAMGMTWKDLMGERPKMDPTLRSRMIDEQRLADMRKIRRLLISNEYNFQRSDMGQGKGKAMCIEVDLRFTVVAELNRHIRALDEKLNPELKEIRVRDEKTARFVQRWGWDKLWEMWLESPEGKAA